MFVIPKWERSVFSFSADKIKDQVLRSGGYEPPFPLKWKTKKGHKRLLRAKTEKASSLESRPEP